MQNMPAFLPHPGWRALPTQTHPQPPPEPYPQPPALTKARPPDPTLTPTRSPTPTLPWPLPKARALHRVGVGGVRVERDAPLRAIA